jgi:hypothetical protein
MPGQAKGIFLEYAGAVFAGFFAGHVGGQHYLFWRYCSSGGVYGAYHDQAGALVGLTLSRLHLLGIIAGVIYLVATAAGQRSLRRWCGLRRCLCLR